MGIRNYACKYSKDSIKVKAKSIKRGALSNILSFIHIDSIFLNGTFSVYNGCKDCDRDNWYRTYPKSYIPIVIGFEIHSMSSIKDNCTNKHKDSISSYLKGSNSIKQRALSNKN